MKYNARSFEDIYRLSDFLNENNIKPTDIVGIYRVYKYQGQGCFNLLYIESDEKKEVKTYEDAYNDFFEWLKNRNGEQGEQRKMTNAELFEKTFGRFATEIWALPEKYFCEWLKADAEDMEGVKKNDKRRFRFY